MVKIYERAHLGYNITNEKPTRFKKKTNSNYWRNTIPIYLDDNKYRSGGRCTFFIKSELKCKPHENTACVFLTWQRNICSFSLMWKWMVGFISKFQGRCIKIDNSFDPRYQINDFLQYLTCHCTVSDVIMIYRFLCVELASTSLSLWPNTVQNLIDWFGDKNIGNSSNFNATIL